MAANWSLEALSAHGRDREHWHRLLSALPAEQRDVYILPEYVALYEDVYREPTVMLRYGDDRQGVLMVVASRSITGLPFYKSCFASRELAYQDLTSPYGYGGPVVYGCNEGNQAELFSAFREEFHEYCVRNSVVTEFLRLHPLMQTHLPFGNDTGLYQKNYTVWIDLRGNASSIYDGMRKNHRRNVRKATSEGVEVVLSDLRAEHVREFYRLYTSRMQELGALPVFFFPLGFFQEAVATLKGHISCFLAKWKGKVVSAHMFLHSGPYINSFLSGSDSGHRELNANVLTVYQAALYAKERGCRFFHLGSGHAFELDSVLQFKSQFSRNKAPYYMYRHVHDTAAYETLCKMKEEFDREDVPDNPTVDTAQDPLLVDYFPAYRA